MLDEAVRFYLRALGTSGSGYGIGSLAANWGSSGAVQNIKQLAVWDYQESLDVDPQSALSSKIAELERVIAADYYAKNSMSAFVLALNSHVASYNVAGVRGLDSYLTYLNTGGSPKWQALQHPDWRTLNPSPAPTACNVYFEVLQGATYPNALWKHIIGGTDTAGYAIDSDLYCGGFPVVRISGISGTGTVTVTGTAFDPATGTISTGKTWTVAVTANGLWFMAVGTAPADSLIIDVTDVDPGALGGGTIYIEAWRPSVRDAAAAAGSGTTITLDASASAIDDYYVGLPIVQAADRYLGGRTIIDYVGSTKVATVNSAWGTNPSATTNFKILRDDLP